MKIDSIVWKCEQDKEAYIRPISLHAHLLVCVHKRFHLTLNSWNHAAACLTARVSALADEKAREAAASHSRDIKAKARQVSQLQQQLQLRSQELAEANVELNQAEVGPKLTI